MLDEFDTHLIPCCASNVPKNLNDVRLRKDLGVVKLGLPKDLGDVSNPFTPTIVARRRKNEPLYPSGSL